MYIIKFLVVVNYLESYITLSLVKDSLSFHIATITLFSNFILPVSITFEAATLASVNDVEEFEHFQDPKRKMDQKSVFSHSYTNGFFS